MFRSNLRRSFLPVVFCFCIAACGGGDNASSPEIQVTESQAVAAEVDDLPASLGENEYDRLLEELDSIPERIIPRIEPEERLRFSSVEDASRQLIAAVADLDHARADQILASVDAAGRGQLMIAVSMASNDAWNETRQSGNYATAYSFERYLRFDAINLWQLDGEYLQVRVADGTTGAPIAGATATVQDPWASTVRSDDAGRFRILLPPQGAAFNLSHPDYDDQFVYETESGQRINPGALAGEEIEINLAATNVVVRPDLPSLTFRGRVVDAETGQALAGVPVIAGFDPIEGATDVNLQQAMGKFGRETDADGRFEITELPVQTVRVIAQAAQDGKVYQLQLSDYQFEEGVEHVIEIQGNAVRLDIPLVVVGTVMDRVTGQPVANARVSAGGWKAERTDVNGRFMIQLDTGEDWQLTASHDEYHQSQPQPFASAEPQTIEAEFLIDPITTGTILGIAINAVTGEPIVNAVIEIAGKQIRTDSQGRFRATEIESGEVMVNGAQSGYRADSQSLLLEALQTAEATLKLDPITTGTVSGIVLEEGSGNPLPGVAVTAGDKQVVTGDDGAFILEDVEAGAITVGASKALFVPGSSDLMLEAMGTAEARIELTPITWGTVHGHVSDASSGEALSNATVRIGAVKVTTDNNGDYIAERVPAGEFAVSAGLIRYHDAQAAIELPRDGDVEQSLQLAPITTGTVFASIIDATSGEPINGAEVMIGQRRNATDSGGQVTAEEIPAGRVVANASARLYEPGSVEAVLDAAGESRLEIKLVPITYGTIVGTITNSASGAPLANATVSFAGLQLRSNAAGTFRAERVPAGTVSVSAELIRYRGDQETVALERGTEQEVSLQLEPITTGTVRGVVRSTADRQPINGATVTIGNLSARSNADGRFEIEQVPAGDMSVRASLTLFEPGESPVMVEAAGAVETEINLTPITYGTVSGTVVDAMTGSPLEGASVSAGRQSTRTNASGEFEMQRVAAGDFSVAASKAVYLDDSKAIALSPGATEVVSLKLAAITWGTITGIVTDAETGRPLANAEVVVATQALRSDADGRFRAEKVPAGALRVAGKVPAYEPGSVSAELQADTEREVTLALTPIRIGDISGTVLDAKTGEPIGQARVTTGRLAAETDTGGKFRFQSVNTGANVVAAQHPDYANGSVSADVPPAESVDVIIRLDLRREDVTNLEAELAKSGTIDLYGIYFDSGKAQFKPSSLSTLRAVLEVMKRAPDRRFRIGGHTDSDGGDDYNQDLSERRAKTVIGWLVDNGIDAGRLDGVGFGETRPAAPNDTESGKALNRRVQLSFAN